MSESDWKVVESALDMWRASQVAIRGHVQVVSEAVARLRKQSEEVARERDAWKVEAEHWSARAQELEAALREATDALPGLAEQQAMPDDWWKPIEERARKALGT